MAHLHHNFAENLERMKEKTSAGAARNLSKKLHPIDILRKFAIGMTVVSDYLRTLRIKMISITLPFDSRKSRKFTRISQWIASDAHTYMAWVAPAVLLIRVVREPTWAKCRRVCSRLLFLLHSNHADGSHGSEQPSC